MSRFFIVIIISTIYFSSCATVPEMYYQEAFNKSGEELKIMLNEQIKDHKTYPYTASRTDVWDILKEADKDTINPENVILFYTDRSVNAAQEYNRGKGWTREHIWAKSRGDFGTREGPGTDCHCLRAVDASVNSTRNNRYFGVGGSEIWDDEVFTGCYVGIENYTFEPRDEIKGDVARMIFYMVVRYEGNDNYPDLELTNSILLKSDKSPKIGVQSILLKWHMQDPVSKEEVKRNEIIFKYQKNRNPFIDHPEFANLIWN